MNILSKLVLLAIITPILLSSCSKPRPTVAPVAPAATGPATQATQNPETLPANAWFSMQAVGRTSASASDLVVVYQDGRVIYEDQSKGQRFERQFNDQEKANWQRVFADYVHFMDLKDNYPATNPGPDDSVHYTFRYRQNGTVKTVKAQVSGSPQELQILITQLWRLVDEMQITS